MDKDILVINAGSSSIKFAVYLWQTGGNLTEDLHGQIEDIGNHPHFKAIDSSKKTLVDNLLQSTETLSFKDCFKIISAWLEEYAQGREIAAIGHRVVHGGIKYTAPVIVDDLVLNDLESLVPLAALHQPHNLAAIRAFQELLPGVPQIACFDTAFHHSQPEMAKYYGLPRSYFEQGIRRYGFHGLSYEYLTRVLPSLDAGISEARIIAAHLGNGASLCAIRNGRSVATTMGFSVLDGLIMGTRCGSLDPAVVLYLLSTCKMDLPAVERLLYHESGLFGLSGLSNDMKKLLESASEEARLAVNLFIYRAVRETGSLAAALGGLDALVFTGGIGEHSAEIRGKICGQLSWLGLDIDAEANQASASRISSRDSRISVWVVLADENRIIASHTQQLLM